MKPTYIHTGPDKLVSLVEKTSKMTTHKVYDQNKKLVFEGEPEEVYEFILKTMSVKDEDSKIKYENYLKNKKK